MADIMSILQSSYTATSQSLISPGSKFANVDPTKWQGSWTGLDVHHQPVSVSITKVPRLPRQCDLNELGRRGVSKGLHHHQELVPDRRFQLCADRRRQGARVTTIITDPTTGNQSEESTPVTLKT